MHLYNDQIRSSNEMPQKNALLVLETKIVDDWIDYNGHMTEWQYYKILADAGENFLRIMGFTEEYRSQGYSFFSVQGHLRNLNECRTGTNLKVYTETLAYDDIYLHIYQYIIDEGRDLVVATGEHLMIHVDTNKRRSVKIGSYMRDCLDKALNSWSPGICPKGMSSSVKKIL